MIRATGAEIVEQRKKFESLLDELCVIEEPYKNLSARVALEYAVLRGMEGDSE